MKKKIMSINQSRSGVKCITTDKNIIVKSKNQSLHSSLHAEFKST